MRCDGDGGGVREAGMRTRGEEELKANRKATQCGHGPGDKGQARDHTRRYRPLRMTTDGFRGRSHCGTWSPRPAWAVGGSHKYK